MINAALKYTNANRDRLAFFFTTNQNYESVNQLKCLSVIQIEIGIFFDYKSSIYITIKTIKNE